MANELKELHTWVRNTNIDASFLTNTVSIWPTHRVPLVAFGGWGVTQSGAGVTPLSDSSLLVYRTQNGNPMGIQAGDPRLRSMIIEAAWSAIRQDQELAEFYHRVYQRHPRDRAARKAIVAVARKLTERMYCVLKERRVYIKHPVQGTK